MNWRKREQVEKERVSRAWDGRKTAWLPEEISPSARKMKGDRVGWWRWGDGLRGDDKFLNKKALRKGETRRGDKKKK